MTRRAGAVLGLCVAMAAAGPALAADKADPSSIAFRAKFIEDFSHIILDTAADDAMFLRICVDAAGAKRGIEVGTARAFGAMNMGIAFERRGGHLYTVDISPQMVDKARANLKTVALDKTVTVILGDALKVLPKMEGTYDFVFLDAVKRDYMKYYTAVADKLVDGALITADNTIRSARAMPDFLKTMDGPEFDAVTVRASMKKGDGMTLAYKIPKAKRSPGPMTTAEREVVLKELARAKGDATVIDAKLLRIFAEASGAKHGLAFTADGGAAAVNLGIAFERTGGNVRVVCDKGKRESTDRNVGIARLKKSVTVLEGTLVDYLRAVEGPIDFLFLDGTPEDYVKSFKAVESKLKTGAIIIADNTRGGGKAKAFVDYLIKSPNYNAVTLRHADKRKTDGMTVAYKIPDARPTTEAKTDKTWTPLFNGKDLTGWQVKCKPADKGKTFWTAKDGMIVCDSTGRKKHDYVWLMTKREYGDFELKLKVRGHAPKSRGNSGVQVRSRYDDKAGWLDGPQVDIHPPAPWRTGLIYDETRETKRWISPSLKNWKITRAQGPKECRWKRGDWNDLTIRCEGTKIVTRLNGLTVTDFDGKGVLDDAAHRKHNVGLTGYIALQLHSRDELLIEFKYFLIRELK